MKLASLKTKLTDIVIAAAILSLLAVALYLAFDPRQAANRKHDSQFAPTATRIGKTVTDYLAKKESSTESIGFADARSVLTDMGLFDQFAGDSFIVDNSVNFFIGKEEGKTDSVYVCYAPVSEFVRDSHCNDSFVYTLNRDGTRSKVTCDIKSVWQTGENPWVVCSPK